MGGLSAWPTTRVTLLHRIKNAEDTNSWEAFVNLYSPLVYRYCRKRGLQDADAHDVTQDVFVQVSNGIQRFKYQPERGRFRSWLGTITHRAMLKQIARSKRVGQGVGQEISPALLQCEGAAADGEWIETFNAYLYEQAIRRVRTQFADDVWRVFELTFESSRPSEEVAQELAKSVAWVYQAKYQVVRRLKEEILYLASDTNLFSR